MKKGLLVLAIAAMFEGATCYGMSEVDDKLAKLEQAQDQHSVQMKALLAEFVQVVSLANRSDHYRRERYRLLDRREELRKKKQTPEVQQELESIKNEIGKPNSPLAIINSTSGILEMRLHQLSVEWDKLRNSDDPYSDDLYDKYINNEDYILPLEYPLTDKEIQRLRDVYIKTMSAHYGNFNAADLTDAKFFSIIGYDPNTSK